MVNHFSSIGFLIEGQAGIVALAQNLVGHAQTIHANGGQYLRWTGSSGEEIWLQVNQHGELIGMNPHFVGRSSVCVAVESRVHRENDTALDGAFHGWADPEGDTAEKGAYPFVFDSPDFATHSEFQIPGVAEVQIAAFAHEIAFYDSTEAFNASQADAEVKFASQSFIPSGLFIPDEGKKEQPEAYAIFTGYVVEAALHNNSITGSSFYWALVETLGARYDVVIDQSLLPALPTSGGVISGQFWLSGRLTSYAKRKKTWYSGLFRGAG